MTRWQRRARLVLGVFVVVFAAFVFSAIRRRPVEAPHAPVTRTDPKAVVEVTGGRYNEMKGAHLPYDGLKFEKSFTYEDGRSRLLQVTARIARAGRTFDVTADQADVARDQSDLALQGHVHVVSDDGMDVRTDAATYSNGEAIIRAPGPVAFSKGNVTGHAVGMTYDQQRDVVWLLDQVEIESPGDGEERATRITAGKAGWARADKYLRFEGAVKMVRGDRTLEADTATAYLTEDEQHITLVELRGQARITAATAVPGSFRAMRAANINLTYAGTGERLERATLAEDAKIDLAGGAEGAGRTLAAGWLDLGLSDDGTTVNRVSGHDAVQLRLPAEGGTPERVVRAAGIEGKGPAGGAITAVRFTGEPGRVEFREAAPAPADPRVALARTLDVTTKPGFGPLERAVFGGGTEFTEGGLKGTARDARYDVTRGVLDLEGEQDGRRPQLVDEGAAIEATAISVMLEGRAVSARGSVRSVLQPAAGTPPRKSPSPARPVAPAATTKMPALLDAGQLTMGTADTMTYDGDGGQVVYTGKPARLWQTDTSIYANEIQLDETKGDLHAVGAVVSTLLFAEPPAPAPAATGASAAPAAAPRSPAVAAEPERAQWIGRADELRYEEAVRRATYRGGAHLAGPLGSVTAETVDLYVADGGGALDRLEAKGAITLTREGRVATGDQLRYFAADGRYEVTGAPAVLAIPAECRQSNGKTLTFFKSTARIVVDGKEETRTQTKGGAKCGEPRFD